MSENKITLKIERVYSDVVGPVSPSNIGGYPKSFIDEISVYLVVKFMKCKAQALKAFKKCVAQFVRPKILGIDIRIEYRNKAFQMFCISKEMALEFTVPETTEQMVLQNILIGQW